MKAPALAALSLVHLFICSLPYAAAAAGCGLAGASCFGWGYHPCTASITKKPITYASVTCQPPRTHAIAFLPSGYMFDSATPADEPNQIIDPPKPTAYATKPQS